ncbi:MAG: type II toxin-antitoxin system RelE/ParE family toxin [Deltaproteobacteria bacterium]|nr:type II toxin-antitoxin system RelE/ParE family toxin [Deltaproteobacteria bacterium]
MKHCVELKESALRDLKNLSKKDAIRILEKIEILKDGLKGDVKRLANFSPEYRLRVGNFRVLFEIEKGNIIIYGIKHRKESYR